MKKSIVLIIIFTTLFIFGNVASATAAKSYPVKEISGIIQSVTIDTENQYTTIEFKGGRIITFKGVYQGQVFCKDKDCSIEYQYIDVMFSEGTYITDIDCCKEK